MIPPRRLPPLWGLALLLALPGCGPSLSPEAACFADATIAYRAAWRGAQKIRADLARGYALHETSIATTKAVTCRVDGQREPCLANARAPLTVPVPIDRARLTARLAAFDAKMEALRPVAMLAAAPCGYGDWADPAPPPPAPAP